METRNYHQPKIEQVLALSGPQSGNAVSNAEGGTVLCIKGANFGKDPAHIHILFGKNSVPVLPILFSNNTLAVQVPILSSPTKTLSVVAGELSTSDPIDFHLVPGINPEYAGSAIVELYNMMDTYAFLLGRTAKLAPISPSRRLLMDVSVNYLNGARTSARQSLNMLMQWQQYQPEIKQAPIRTLEFTENIIREGGMVHNVVSMIDLTTGPGGWLGPVIKKSGIGNFVGGLIDGAEDLFDDFKDEIGSIFKKASDFIEEHTKLFDGLENHLKVATPSLSAEVGVGVDVSFSSGEAFSAAVRGIDAIGQIFGQDVPETSDPLDEIKEAIGKLEAKADTQGTTLSGIKEDLAKQEEKSDRITEGLSEVKNYLGKLEEKADIIEAKLDRSEEKQDRHEEKLDIIEAKLDRAEEKQDRQEEKLDVLEAKADRQESKLDRLEEKTDKQEMKLDKLESKADRHEKKLDKLEGKADRQERKLDKIEAKFDRLNQPTPTSESSIASQRGGNDKVSATIAAIKEQDNKVYMKFAIDIEQNQLDQPGAYSQWIDFDRPANAARLVAVSIDLQYEDGSNNIINGLLTAQAENGVICQRSLEESDHQNLKDSNKWTDWNQFPGKP